MRLEEAQVYGTTRAAQKALANLARKPARGHSHHPKLESVREADHAGHHIFIRTKYTITVDGRPLVTPLEVTPNGDVICHALPNYSFSSAVDLVKRLVDTYPADFAKGARGRGHAGHVHGGKARARSRTRRKPGTRRAPSRHSHHG